MTDREKIINGLECCSKGNCADCDNCTYHEVQTDVPCESTLMREALTLLKAQEPRVMTWQDVIGAAIERKPFYIEVKNSWYKEPGDDRWAMVIQYNDNITNGMIRVISFYMTNEVLFAEDYGKRWRCWTSRPTDEQMEAVKWDDDILP